MDWLETEITSLPAAEPLTVDEVKTQAEIVASDRDGLLTDYIEAARRYVEKANNIALITQTAVFRRERFCERMPLPLAPVASISSVRYLDAAGVEQTLDTSVYTAHLAGLSPMICRAYNQCWPVTYCAPDAVRITAVLGYGADGAAVPIEIRRAMVLIASHWFGNREPVTTADHFGELPYSVTALLANHRRFAF